MLCVVIHHSNIKRHVLHFKFNIIFQKMMNMSPFISLFNRQHSKYRAKAVTINYVQILRDPLPRKEISTTGVKACDENVHVYAVPFISKVVLRVRKHSHVFDLCDRIIEEFRRLFLY
jgi:hypothetical protein